MPQLLPINKCTHYIKLLNQRMRHIIRNVNKYFRACLQDRLKSVRNCQQQRTPIIFIIFIFYQLRHSITYSQKPIDYWLRFNTFFYCLLFLALTSFAWHAPSSLPPFFLLFFSTFFFLPSHPLNNHIKSVYNQMRKLFNVAATATGLGALFYTYISYKVSSNYSAYIAELRQIQKLGSSAEYSYPVATKAENEKNTSQLKSGDNLFINYNPQEALTASQYLRGYLKSFFKLRNEFDSFGYIYKNGSDTYILYNQFGETKLKKYEEFVELPFLVCLYVQINNDGIDFQTKLRELLEKQPGVVDIETKKESQIDMVNRINQHLYQKKFEFCPDVRMMLKSQAQHFFINTKIERLIKKLNQN